MHWKAETQAHLLMAITHSLCQKEIPWYAPIILQGRKPENPRTLSAMGSLFTLPPLGSSLSCHICHAPLGRCLSRKAKISPVYHGSFHHGSIRHTDIFWENYEYLKGKLNYPMQWMRMVADVFIARLKCKVALLVYCTFKKF